MRPLPLQTVLLGILLLVPGPTPAFAQNAGDWPGWRGPRRDGTVGSFTTRADWPERLNLRWRVTVGEGYATPLLVGGRLYVFARQGDDEVMLAMDPATGDPLWRTGYPAPFAFESAAEPHGPGPKATPAFADGRLFTLGLGGVVTAFDAETGEILWQKPPPQVAPLYGTAASPLVDGSRVIVHVGGHGAGALSAFDVRTGEPVWSWDGDGPSYASPVVAVVGGTPQIITLSQEKVIGVSPADGSLLWERPFTTGFTQNIITPILHGDLVIVTGFQVPMAAFRVAREGGGWVTEDVWENPDTAFYMANGVLLDDRIFGLSERNSGQYVLIDADDGTTLWAGTGRQAENAAIVTSGDRVIVLEDDAELIIGRVSPTGFDEIRRYPVADSATWAQPVLSGDRIFIRDVTGLALWTVD